MTFCDNLPRLHSRDEHDASHVARGVPLRRPHVGAVVGYAQDEAEDKTRHYDGYRHHGHHQESRPVREQRRCIVTSCKLSHDAKKAPDTETLREGKCTVGARAGKPY